MSPPINLVEPDTGGQQHHQQPQQGESVTVNKRDDRCDSGSSPPLSQTLIPQSIDAINGEGADDENISILLSTSSISPGSHRSNNNSCSKLDSSDEFRKDDSDSNDSNYPNETTNLILDKKFQLSTNLSALECSENSSLLISSDSSSSSSSASNKPEAALEQHSSEIPMSASFKSVNPRPPNTLALHTNYYPPAGYMLLNSSQQGSQVSSSPSPSSSPSVYSGALLQQPPQPPPLIYQPPPPPPPFLAHPNYYATYPPPPQPILLSPDPNSLPPTMHPSSAAQTPTTSSTIYVHVDSGHVFQVQVGDEIREIFGPATVKMVSTDGTQPVPIQLNQPAPGQLVQQIVDENGVLTHLILSSQPPFAPPLPFNPTQAQSPAPKSTANSSNTANVNKFITIKIYQVIGYFNYAQTKNISMWHI